MPDSFQLVSDYEPAGDQPQAIASLTESVLSGNRNQTLLGVTGSGKTFTVAHLIQEINRPTLVISHNKTLAAQLYSEFKSFFPNNAVEYFVSYYDYYQPEAYIPQTDTYIEKDSSINDEIERLRISATSSLISRRDVIVVASVSCIYGLGSPDDFAEMMIPLKTGMELDRDRFLEKLVNNQYQRNDIQLGRGNFRVRGEVVDVMPAYMEEGIRVEFWGDEVERIRMFDPISGNPGQELDSFSLYPANQYITPKDKLAIAIQGIRKELEERIAILEKEGRLLEAQRIRMRTDYDLEMLQEMGFCSGIENYSRHLSGRQSGDRPFCLLDFFPKDFFLVVDESHVTLPQVRAMYAGDRSRKERLVEYGFRLPSALDNRPLRWEEFQQVTGQTLYVSATPDRYEIENSSQVVQQVIRPTGLLDPEVIRKPISGQVEDLIGEVLKAVEAGERTLVTTLTKRMSEDLSGYMRERGIKVEYLHSDIDTIERVEILRRLRQGEFDVLVGVNLLREGLDLPEVALVAILDADKEGFLRSYTSLIQTIGRAARHERGRVILYADVLTESLRKTIQVTRERRERQIEWNQQHGITPRSVRRAIQRSLHQSRESDSSSRLVLRETDGDDVALVIRELEEDMLMAASKLEFERAALLRDQIDRLRANNDSSAQGKSAGGRRKGTRYKRR